MSDTSDTPITARHVDASEISITPCAQPSTLRLAGEGARLTGGEVRGRGREVKHVCKSNKSNCAVGDDRAFIHLTLFNQPTLEVPHG